MIAFLLYLIESTICLSILFGVYLLFFRKETFLLFNRWYLLSIMLFSVIIPLVHVSVSWSRVEAFESSVLEIQHVKSYYSRIIALTDPEFRVPGSTSSFATAFEDFTGQNSAASSSGRQNHLPGSEPAAGSFAVSNNNQQHFTWIGFIRWIYLGGIALFFFRLVGLFYWLIRTIRNNPCIRHGMHIIVQLEEEVPPFSFFRYVFVNKDVYSKADFEQILFHELAHIRQLHSLDLTLAHSLSILQWFNPLVWQLQKAIKTNHEYLADRHVVNQGFELFDYQSLLLTQLISIRSVELVNNFNLLSIKKRIAMMTQVKSGIAAKLKILLIIPFAIALFLFFADMTFYSAGRSFTNFIALKSPYDLGNFQGIWENLDEDSYGRLLAIDGNSVSILENESNLKEYKARMTETAIILELWPGETVELAYTYRGDILQVWWSEAGYSTYRRTDQTNSLALSIGELGNQIELPVFEEYVKIDWQEYINIVYTGKSLQVGDKAGSLAEVGALIKAQKEGLNKLSMKTMTVKLFIDKNVLMRDLDIILNTLRNNHLLKVAYMGYPANGTGSVLLAHAYGRTSLLPPLEGIEVLSEEEAGNQGIGLFTIEVMDKNNSPAKTKPLLKDFIHASEKYITPVEYENSSRYSDFLAYYDMVFAAIAELRNELAVENYQAKYDELSRIDQDKIRKRYPVTVVMKNREEQPR